MALDGLRKREKQVVIKLKQRISEIGKHIWYQHVDITNVGMAETMDHLSVREARSLKYKAVKDGQAWGKLWGTAWFRLRSKVPASFRGKAVYLLFHPEGEGIVFQGERLLQGLNPGREDCLLLKKAKGGERLELYVETGANQAFGQYKRRTMHQPRLAVFSPAVNKAYWDLQALWEIIDPATPAFGWRGSAAPARALDEDDPWRAQIIRALNQAVDMFDYRTDSRAVIEDCARKISRTLQPLYAHTATDSAQTLACMGHAHIDVAWLWPLAETKRKCGRTFSNILALMDRYPEFIFCQSQPQLYEYTKQKYPALYRRIKEKVRKKQWIPTGSAWVEMDCNVTSGESLVRQMLFGIRFFQSEFNHTPACLWLPDVFGYSAALPQILKQCGIDYFLTQKISWSQFTTFPFHSFHWEGIDGSRVLSHFPPNNNYNSRLVGLRMINASRRYLQKDCSSIQATLFGYGDGGGGAQTEHLERRRRYENLEGVPKLKPMSPAQFFAKLDKESHAFPEWIGELYLEYHRGTYTTEAWTKRLNRKSELALRDAEMWSAFNTALLGRKYEQKKLNDAWKLTLLNQFHDILPGSSIAAVYEEAERDYATVLETSAGVSLKALNSLDRAIDTSGAKRPVVARNSLSWERSNVTEFKLRGPRGKSFVAVAPDGTREPVQLGSDGMARFNAQVPAVGHRVYDIEAGKPDADSVRASAKSLENELLRAKFDAQGRLVSLFDKENRREAVEPGSHANQFVLFEDKTIECGAAWDIDIYYNDKPVETDGKLVSAKVVEQGPVRSVVRFTRQISESTITQDVILNAGARQLDFATTVDWGDEKDVLLKVAFPVAVRSDEARYEIQFGNVLRPTHWNTPQDFARFEVSAQKWVDLSEGDYGVALLNDCKYGHDTRGNVMRLTLLRAPTHSALGGRADTNRRHRVTYSLMPHTGDYTNGVVRAGYELNVPLHARQTKSLKGSLPCESSLVSVTGTNVIIDTIKKAEDSDALIVRMYEAHGCRGQRTLKLGFDAKTATETNLLEKDIRKLNVQKNSVKLSFKPFQIRTVKLKT